MTTPMPGRKAGGLNVLTFDNRFTRELPADPEAANRRRQVMGACYSLVAPIQGGLAEIDRLLP